MLRLMSGCITALVLAGQASVHAETMAELYEKAKVEKELASIPAALRPRTRTAPSCSCSNIPVSR